MGLKETVEQLEKYLIAISKDLTKATRGNKAASQRVRTGSIKFERLAKTYRKESVKAEKGKKKVAKKTAKKPAKKAGKKVVKKAIKKVVKSKKAKKGKKR